MTDHLTSLRRSENMAAIRSKNTKPEISVRRLLHRMDYRFRLHSQLPGHPDIVFKGRKKVIFVHGCFWHRHQNCKYATVPQTNSAFWNEKFLKNIDRDFKSQSTLSSQGWKILIVWQCELKDPKQLTTKLRRFLGH